MNAPTGSRMLPTDRIDYSAIAERPALKLPGGACMAIWVIVNVEEWDPKDTMPRTVLIKATIRRTAMHTSKDRGIIRTRAPGSCSSRSLSSPFSPSLEA